MTAVDLRGPACRVHCWHEAVVARISSLGRSSPLAHGPRKSRFVHQSRLLFGGKIGTAGWETRLPGLWVVDAAPDPAPAGMGGDALAGLS
jgi:hypothetical protein